MSHLEVMQNYKKRLASLSDRKLSQEGEKFAKAMRIIPLTRPEQIAAAQAMTMMIRNEIMKRVK